MRTLYVNVEIGEQIAELIKKHSRSSHLKNIADTIEIICAQAGEDGYFTMTGQKFKKKRKAWTGRETERFILVVKSYRKTEYWERGKQKLAWAMMGEELGRDPGSLKTKYNELVRKGIIESE